MSEENPCVYKETNLKEYVTLRITKGMDQSAPAPFKVPSMKV